jgi:hypothetical protein
VQTLTYLFSLFEKWWCEIEKETKVEEGCGGKWECVGEKKVVKKRGG